MRLVVACILLLVASSCGGGESGAAKGTTSTIVATEAAPPAEERWQGTLTEHYRDGVTGSAEADLDLTLDPDGSVVGRGSGSGVINGNSFTFNVRIRGVRADDAFRLRISSSASRRTFTIAAPIAGTRARGKYEEPHAVVNVSLICPTC